MREKEYRCQLVYGIFLKNTVYHHIAHFKYHIIFLNYTTIKVKKKACQIQVGKKKEYCLLIFFLTSRKEINSYWIYKFRGYCFDKLWITFFWSAGLPGVLHHLCTAQRLLKVTVAAEVQPLLSLTKPRTLVRGCVDSKWYLSSNPVLRGSDFLKLTRIYHVC